MRIGLYTPNYPGISGDGGIGTYTRHLARTLSAGGHLVHTVTRGPAPQEHHLDGVHVSVVATSHLPIVDRLLPGAGPTMRIGSTALALTEQASLDLFEFTNWEGLGIWFALRRKVPFVVRLSTSSAESQQIDGLLPSWQLRSDVAREKYQTKLADALVTHSRAHRETMVHELGIDADRIQIIPLGVQVDPGFKREEHPASENTVVFLGRMERRKGAIDLIHAIPKVLAAAPDTRFLFIGPDRPHCPGGLTHRDYIDRTLTGEARSRVTLAGSLSDAEVTAHLQSADVFVAPSLYESFGLIFLEAMRWGTPVIGTTAGGIPEIVEHDRSGLLVTPSSPDELAAAISALLADPSRRRRLGEAGRRRVEAQFSVEAMAARSLDLYRDVTARAGRSRR